MSLYRIPHSAAGLLWDATLKARDVQQYKATSVLDWLVWLGRDLIVYSGVLCFQVTLALMGVIRSGLDVYCSRWSNRVSAKRWKVFFPNLKSTQQQFHCVNLKSQEKKAIVHIYVAFLCSLSSLFTSSWFQNHHSQTLCCSLWATIMFWSSLSASVAECRHNLALIVITKCTKHSKIHIGDNPQ